MSAWRLRVSSYYSRSSGGSVLTAAVFDGYSSCSSENGTFVYDDAGHVIRSQDAPGYVTDRRTSADSWRRLMGR
ncbi:MAG TPA: hypothetical protein VF219_10235 [Vicinamibacterales bacterium]